MSAVRLLPWPVHEAVDYLLGLFFVVAPFVLGLRESVAFPVFIAVGVVVLANTLLTPGPLAVARILPVRVHAVLDYILAFFLILAPFVFGFADDDTALTVSIFAGVAVLVTSLVTAFPLGEPSSAAAGEGSTAA
jgi:hypothetical protein